MEKPPGLILGEQERRRIFSEDLANLSFDVSEIFFSVQGEGTRAGLPCVFVRLYGCKLRCSYCDTLYAIDRRFPADAVLTGGEILARARAFHCNFVEFTGGEPLEQPNVFPLMKRLCDEGFTVAVETGGHVDISPCDERVIRIIDMKTPSSKMSSMNKYENLDALRLLDEVKFVVGSREDYEWARELTLQRGLAEKTAAVLFSPVFGKIEYKELAAWILEDRLPVRFQLQMHKFIWRPDERGV